MAGLCYLTADNVKALHEFIMTKTRAAPADLRDPDELESAVEAPQVAVEIEGENLLHQAALLAIHLGRARAFAEGNKRTAYIALDTFLQNNNAVFTGDPIEFAKQLEAAINGPPSGPVDIDEAVNSLETWLRPKVELPRAV